MSSLAQQFLSHSPAVLLIILKQKGQSLAAPQRGSHSCFLLPPRDQIELSITRLYLPSTFSFLGDSLSRRCQARQHEAVQLGVLVRTSHKTSNLLTPVCVWPLPSLSCVVTGAPEKRGYESSARWDLGGCFGKCQGATTGPLVIWTHSHRSNRYLFEPAKPSKSPCLNEGILFTRRAPALPFSCSLRCLSGPFGLTSAVVTDTYAPTNR